MSAIFQSSIYNKIPVIVFLPKKTKKILAEFIKTAKNQVRDN